MKTKKQIAILLVMALIITSVPNILSATIVTAKEVWKILSEEDLVIDEVYNINNGVMIGRKDGKISFLDKNLQLIKQTEYDQIEDYMAMEWLVSRLADGETEFAILNQTGEVKRVLGTYDMVSMFYAMNEEEYFLFARKENGQYGFLIDEKETGFDDVFAGEEGMICAEILTVGEKNYYVKEYFENEEVQGNIGGIGLLYYDDGISVQEFQKKLLMENCEFVFYDEEGTVVSSGTIVENMKTQEEQEKIQKEETENKKKEIKEEAKQMPIAEYGAATWKGYRDFNINNIVVSKFGKGYLAYIRVKIYIETVDGDYESETMYFVGIYDSVGKLQKFGELLATDGEYEEWYEYEYEGEYLVLREMNKKIYLYYLGTEKYIYTDENNDYSSFMYDENSVYDGKVILWNEDYANVLVANPQSDFLEIAKRYFYMSVNDDTRNVLLLETADSKQLSFYDYQWNEIKKIDLSYLEDDFRYKKYDAGIAAYDSKRYIYIDAYGNDYQISLLDYPEFKKVKDIYIVKGDIYAYIESEKGNILYRLGNMDMLEITDNVEIRRPAIIEGQGFLVYKIVTENGQSYYGLMDFQGNFVIDAIKMGYTKGSVWIRNGSTENMCAYFEDEQGNEFYYYEKTLIAHSDWDDWDVSDSGMRYDDIVYHSNYLYDDEGESIGREEKVCDNDGNVLVGYIVPEKLLRDNGWKNFIYIYETSRTILALNKYWDGKRDSDSSTSVPLITLTPTPSDKPEKTVSPSVEPEKTAVPSEIEPEETVAPSEIEPEKTAASSEIEPKETVAPSGIVKGKGKIKKIKNLKGNRVKLSLKKVKKAKGYQIAYATNKKFRKKKLLTSKKLTITIRKLKKKKTYYFKVRAYYSDNGKKKYGKWGSVKKVKIRR